MIKIIKNLHFFYTVSLDVKLKKLYSHRTLYRKLNPIAPPIIPQLHQSEFRFYKFITLSEVRSSSRKAIRAFRPVLQQRNESQPLCSLLYISFSADCKAGTLLRDFGLSQLEHLWRKAVSLARLR